MKKLLSFLLVISYFFSFYIVKAEDSCKYEVVSEKYDEVKDLQFSPDFKNYSFIARKDGKEFVVKNGEELKKYDEIVYLKYSPNWESYMYWVNNNGNSYLIKDGIESEKYDKIGYFSLGPIGGFAEESEHLFLRYSQDGKNYLYNAKKDGKGIIIKDGVESEKYDYVYDLQISLDGESFAYIIKKDGKDIIVKDGVKIDGYYFQYSPDGKSYSFIAKKDGKYILVKDGKEIEKYDNISGFQYSPDGKSFLFSTYKDGEELLVIDGKESKKYRSIEKILYSLNFKSYAFIANEDFGGNRIIVKDGVETEGYDYIASFNLSPDGKNIIYEAKKDGEWKLMKNGVEIYKLSYFDEEDRRNFYLYDNSQFSPNGESFALGVKSKFRNIILKDGIDIDKYYKYDFLGNFQYLPDNNFIFIGTRDGKQYIVKDGKESNGYDDISELNFSPDSKNLTFITKQDGKEFIINQNCSGKQMSDIYKTFKQSQLKKAEYNITLSKDPKIKELYTELNTILSKCNKTNLENILAKIQKLRSKTRNHPNYKDLFDYLEAKIMIELEK